MTTQKITAPIRSTQARYGRRALVAAIICAVLMLLLGFKPMGKGLVLGTLFSIVNFILIGQALPHQLGHGKGKTIAIALCSLGGRFTLMAIPLIVAIKIDAINLPATIVGLFMVQIVILVEQSWQFYRTPRKSSA
jgi:hypothetical protein